MGVTAMRMKEADLRANLAVGLFLERVPRISQMELERVRVFLERAAREARAKTPSATIPAVQKGVHA